MTDSYTFNTPIGFLTIREEEKKLTKLFWEANSVQTMKNELQKEAIRCAVEISGNAIPTECLAGAAEDTIWRDEKLSGDCGCNRK